ncbi:zinc knuckle CX2CX4HX4C containing protein, partial [Tanacetum coccineum]
QVSMVDKSVEVSKHVYVAVGSNSATPTVVNASLEAFLTVSEAHGIHSPASANAKNMNDAGTINNVMNNGNTMRPNQAGNTPSMSTSYVMLLVNRVGKRVVHHVIANYVRNTWSKYRLVKLMLNSSTRIFSFQFSFMDGLDAMLENGAWFIRNNPLILKKWNLDVNLLKEDVDNVPVWVKLHGVPVTAFS